MNITRRSRYGQDRSLVDTIDMHGQSSSARKWTDCQQGPTSDATALTHKDFNSKIALALPAPSNHHIDHQITQLNHDNCDTPAMPHFRGHMTTALKWSNLANLRRLTPIKDPTLWSHSQACRSQMFPQMCPP